jgi:quercetin dioxygenase-like cupin family protein
MRLSSKNAASVVLLAASLLAGCSHCAAAPAPVLSDGATVRPMPKEITRTLLSQHDVPSMPGWETRLYMIEYPPGASAPPHTHPVPGAGYLLEGRFESAFEGEAPSVTLAGHGFIDKADVVHTVFRNTDPDRPLRFLMAYTIRKGDPVMVPVPAASPAAAH